MCCPNILECLGFHWSMVDLPTTLRWNCPSPSSWPLAMDLFAKGKVVCSVPLSKLAFGLACACLGFENAVPTAVSSFVQLPCCIQKTMSPGGLHHFWLLLFPLPLQWPLSLRRQDIHTICMPAIFFFNMRNWGFREGKQFARDEAGSKLSKLM